MSFYSLEFIGFLILSLLSFYLINPKYQKVVLLVFSSLFIGFYSIYFLTYTYFFISTNYVIIRILGIKKIKDRFRKATCNIGILTNIFFLFFFKYLDLVIDSLNTFLNIINVPATLHHLNFLIPLGISYYTFQGIGYILQVYRGSERIEKDIFVFSNYYLFFPKFLSGPIEKSKTFIPQLKVSQTFYAENLKAGLLLILFGAFKKLIIADRLLVFINALNSGDNNLSGYLTFAVILIQPLHLYCDFSGYTDIALGLGRTFGLNLTDNFNRPFFSTSVSMFWRRWHISLSYWCNEFIFKRILFKRRKWGIWASVYAITVTFFVIGIWHGPNWKYVILGLLQTIAIVYEFLTKKTRLRVAKKLHPYLVLLGGSIVTYLFMSLSLTFFYSKDAMGAFQSILSVFTGNTETSVYNIRLEYFDKILILGSVMLVFTIEFWQEHKLKFINTWWLRPVSIIFLIFLLLINFVTNFKVEPYLYTLF